MKVGWYEDKLTGRSGYVVKDVYGRVLDAKGRYTPAAPEVYSTRTEAVAAGLTFAFDGVLEVRAS